MKRPFSPCQIDFIRHVGNIVSLQQMEVGRCMLLTWAQNLLFEQSLASNQTEVDCQPRLL
jgi:hypothetical protein